MSFYNTLVCQLSRVQDSISAGVASLQDVVRLSNVAGLSSNMSYEGGSVVLSADLFIAGKKSSHTLIITFFGQDALEHEDVIFKALKAGDASSIPVEMVTVNLVTADGHQLLDWDSVPSTIFSIKDIRVLIDTFSEVSSSADSLVEVESILDSHLGYVFERTDY